MPVSLLTYGSRGDVGPMLRPVGVPLGLIGG